MREGDDLELLKVFALADMFCMEDLKNLSCEKFKSQLKEQWKSDAFPDCIREVYSTTKETQALGTRRVAVEEAALHGKELIQKTAIPRSYPGARGLCSRPIIEDCVTRHHVILFQHYWLLGLPMRTNLKGPRTLVPA
jgi:hypothetical protein